MFRTPKPTRIVKIVNEAKRIKTFHLLNEQVSENARPGNFVLVWVPFHVDSHAQENPKTGSLDQIPMSISFVDPIKKIFGITVKDAGSTTREMHKYQDGAYFGIIGPLGNSFSQEGDACILVGGGIGVAPLNYLANALASQGKRLFGFMGFKNKAEMLFAKKMERLFDYLVVTTEDGSYGIKALVTEPLREFLREDKSGLLRSSNKTHVYCCGPELMMKEVLNLCQRFRLSGEFSLERYIHCGIGVCGFCSIDGFRVCKEGPIFTNEQLKSIKDFAFSRRKASGKREAIL